MTHANHSSGTLDDGKILYGGETAGDTHVSSDMSLIRELYEPELCFLPIGDRFTMGRREAAVACRLLQPKKVILMHWGTFPLLTGTPKQLPDMVRHFGTEVWELAQGRPVEW